MWEWPKTTASASGKRARMRARRPSAGPASWSIAMRAPPAIDEPRRGQLRAHLVVVHVALDPLDRRAQRAQIGEARRRS